MKQIRISSFGLPSHMAKCVDVPDVGEPTAWEVVVDIHASVVNPADLARIWGHYGELPTLPAVIGMEGAGVISKVGESVTHLKPGDKVIMLANNNWTQRRRLAAPLVQKVDDDFDLVQAAAFKVNPPTAMMLVRNQVKLKKGDWIVQTAPLSGVGRSLIQIAKHDGLRTVNIVRSEKSAEAVRELGGDAVVVLGDDVVAQVRKAVRQAPIHLAVDAVGGEGMKALGAILSTGGTLVNYGMLSAQPAQLNCEDVIFRGIQLKGFWLTRVLAKMTVAERETLMAEAMQLYRAGMFRTPIAAHFALDDIQAALRMAETRERPGKVALLPQQA